MIQPNEQDITDMITCGQMGRIWHWRKVYYALKNRMLLLYAVPDGWDLQVWYDDAWLGGYGDMQDDEPWACHQHILERYMLNGHLFHKPTDEFSYWNQYSATKQSVNFEHLKLNCKYKIEGKKKGIYTVVGFQALKRLLRRHPYALRGELV
jgi:hypothetical protein